jgi:nitrite reductase/ring-hydroxylating ferredoxin subunit
MSDAPMLVPLGAAEGRSRWVVEHDGRSYAVFVRDDSYIVTDALCPHRSGPLVEGIIRDGAIVCPWHWYTYDLDTGRCRTTKHYHLAIYPVVSRNGALYAEVTVPKPSSWSQILRSRTSGRPRPAG